MGLLSAAKRRKAERERRVHDAAYETAIAQGKTPERAASSAEQAVRDRRRRRAFIFGAVG